MTEALDSEEDGPELAVETKTPETILMNRSNFQLVQRAIDDLPVHYRETLLLCEVEEMSYREIAEILSIPIGTVMSRLARARKAVRESFGNTPGAPPFAEVVAQRAGGNERVSIDQEFAAEKTSLRLTLRLEIEPFEACTRHQKFVGYWLLAFGQT